MTKIELYGCKGCGSAIAEMFLDLGGIAYERFEVDYSTPSAERDRLMALNPLCQVPTLKLPDGKILTETLAIAHYVQSLAPSAKLIPANNVVDFYRWSVFIVAAIYPTWTYGDDPVKWVKDEKVAPQLRESTDEHRKKLWRQVEEQAKGPYFLGAERSAIDLYFAAMVHWRPREAWFEKECPKIAAIARRVTEDPVLERSLRLNFS